MSIALLQIRASAVRIPPTFSVEANAARYFSACQIIEDKNIAVVGGGAAGFYTAARLLAKTNDVNIDIFEKLPAPHGLVRYGVAPDHPEVKNCMSKFNEVAKDTRVRYFGNIPIDGHDKPGCLTVNMLRSVYDGVVLSYGASKDRRLNIPGEDGNGGHVGVISARRFVAWYNGLPEAQDLEPDLTSHDRVVIIGHGNVALDCARILLTPPHVLEKTDITSNAIDKLKQSKIRHVEMVGRRGPLQVSFTTKELREMTKIDNVQIVSDLELLERECESSEGKDYLSQMRPLKRMMDLLRKCAISPTDPQAAQASKTFTLKFLMSPQEVVYDGGLQKLRFQINELEGSPANAKAVAKDATTDIPCAMVLRSIGYASTPLDGVPFDEKKRLVPNIAGRVIDSENNLVEGLYVSGWIKRGPVGVIATTMQDAYRTADAIVMDLANNTIGHNASRAAVDQMLTQANIDQNRVSNDGWKRLEQFEFAAGEALGKPREKVTSVQKMLDIIRNK
ncbi:NADPH-adrenodoxin reductase [Coemansia brasiliensis]|uniref:NADPH:adrenodoxin oxidoreductase, mitochondrial n=1 Tax=Coemansia brasiliensis TaxID=2650707 RepID=A0A9W8M0P7_9FUNG|nr:NADPH-adrenodoxin reductase [Coemansia brasiliensis]